MIFAILTLVSALSISCIAAYFSIIGLSTIFPGSITSVIIMGTALEIGKIVAAVWLHRNWKSAPKLIKSYLFGAIIVLMGITSMGIFGFLSKSHIEHQHTAEKTQAIVSQVDDKIKRELAYIERQKELITKTEGRVDSSEDKSAVNIKREQEKITSLYQSLDRSISFDREELDRLQMRLDELNKEIADLDSGSGGIFSGKKKKLEELRKGQKPERESVAKQMLVINQRIQAARESTESQVSVLREKIEQHQSSEYSTEDTVAEDVEEYNTLIAAALDKIDDLKTERFSHQDGARELEAEVGPIKYVAELVADFTGITLDLGAAVRIVIIILIFVFDPLAILLVLAAHISLAKRFPKFQVNTEKIFEKQAKLQEEKKLLDNEEKKLIERKKDLEEQETLMKLKEQQVEKYQTQVADNKEAARTSRIEAEKAKMNSEEATSSTEEVQELNRRKDEIESDIKKLEKTSILALAEAEKAKAESLAIAPVVEDIEDLIARRDKIKSDLQSITEEKRNVLQKASDYKKDLKEIKEVLGEQQKTRDTIFDLRKDFDGKSEEFASLKSGISELKKQNHDLLKENQILLEREEETPLVEKLSDGSNRIAILSQFGGIHKFTINQEASIGTLLKLKQLSSNLDQACPDQRTAEKLEKTFHTNMWELSLIPDRHMENRLFRKKKIKYKFTP